MSTQPRSLSSPRRSVREGEGLAPDFGQFGFPPLTNDGFYCTFAAGEGGNCEIRSVEIDGQFSREMVDRAVRNGVGPACGYWSQFIKEASSGYVAKPTSLATLV